MPERLQDPGSRRALAPVTDRLLLLASSDDYLLAEALAEAIDAACRELGVDGAEILPDEVTPEAVAVELENPSLFSPRRVLVVRDAARFLDPPTEPQSGDGAPFAEPLLHALAGGIPDDQALILAACCDRKPGGALVKAITRHGRFRWIPLPPAPKPWEEAVVSEEQAAVLRSALRRAVPDARFAPAAEALLLDRLGFAPRLLVEEARKLATAAGPGGTVDEELVLRLTLPQERSLDAVRDAVLKRDLGAVLELVGAAAAGVPITDWRGQRLDPDKLGPAVLRSVDSLLAKLLDLRLLARQVGLEAELNPARTRSPRWQNSVFKPRLAPTLEARLAEDGAASPLNAGKPPSTWYLGRLFSAAGRYREEELVAALSTAAATEASLRGELSLEAVSAWLGQLLEPASKGPARPPDGAGETRPRGQWSTAQ